MTSYYFDTSALTKRYVEEGGSDWIRAVTSKETETLFITSRLTTVELVSALMRRQRERSVSQAAIMTVLRAFDEHSSTDYDFVELNGAVVQVARDVLGRHPLRAYDAIHLASALVANDILTSARLSPLVFVCSDSRLNQAALAEGLTVQNPAVLA